MTLTEPGIITRELNGTPHLFRRSYATCLCQSGMKLKAIPQITRYASMATLTKHYIDDCEAAQGYPRKILA